MTEVDPGRKGRKPAPISPTREQDVFPKAGTLGANHFDGSGVGPVKERRAPRERTPALTAPRRER